MITIKELLYEGINPKDLSVGDIVMDTSKGKWKVTHLNAHKGNTGIPTTFLGVKYRKATGDFAEVHKPIPYKFAKKTTL